MSMEKLDDVESILLAALFVSKEPLKVSDLYRVINDKYVLEKRMKKISKSSIERILSDINMKLEKLNFPYEVKVLPNGSYDISVKDNFFRYVEMLAPYKDFSRATLQTLALIAYKSPIKQKEVVEIRGHRAHEQIKELVERGMVKVEKVGNYNVLRVTKKFLQYFGLKNEDELKEFFAKRYIKEEDFERESNGGKT